MSHEKSRIASRFTAGLLGAVLALQSVFVGLLVSHIQDRSIHHDQQYVTLAAYRADREHFGRSLEEIKLALRDIQKRLEKDQATATEDCGVLDLSFWPSRHDQKSKTLLPEIGGP